MGRTKNTPKKKDDLSLGNCSLSTVGEFIPLFRRKRSKKQSTKDRNRIPSHPVIYLQEQHTQYHLGDLRIGSTSNIIPENIQSCRISFKCDEHENAIILNCDNEYIVVRVFDDVNFLKGLYLYLPGILLQTCQYYFTFLANLCILLLYIL